MTSPPQEAGTHAVPQQNGTDRRDQTKRQQQQQSDQQNDSANSRVAAKRASVEQRQPAAVASKGDAASVRTSDAAANQSPRTEYQKTETPVVNGGHSAPQSAPSQKPPMAPQQTPTKPGAAKTVKIATETQEAPPVGHKTVGRFKVFPSAPVTSSDAATSPAATPSESAETIPAGPGSTKAAASGKAPAGVKAPVAAKAPAGSAKTPIAAKAPVAVAGSHLQQNPAQRPPAPPASGAATPQTQQSPASTPNSSPQPPSGKPPTPAGPPVGKKKGRFVVLAPGQNPPAAAAAAAATAAQAVTQPSVPAADQVESVQQGGPTAVPLPQQPVLQRASTHQGVQQQVPLPQQPVLQRTPSVEQRPAAMLSPGAAEMPRSRGSSLTKTPASFDSKGIASQQGLGKVFYFLDQMRLEVTDADKTIKNLQKELKSFKEKNKELEARAREMERRWTEEKASSETKVRTLRKKVKELKEAVATGGSREGTESAPHSRANSLDSVEEVVEIGKKTPSVAHNPEVSPKKSPSQTVMGAISKLSTISSKESSSLAEKQEMMDLKVDLTSKMPSSDSASSPNEKQHTGDAAKKQASPSKQGQNGDNVSHRRTESLGADSSNVIMSPQRRRGSSENNVEVFLGANSASLSPNGTTPAPVPPNRTAAQAQVQAQAQVPVAKPAAAQRRPSHEFDPLGNGETKTAGDPPAAQVTQAKSSPNLAQAVQGNVFHPLGATPTSEHSLQQAKSSPNILLGENIIGEVENEHSNVGNAVGGQQGVMQQPTMNMPQHQSMGQLHIQGGAGIPSQQMGHRVNHSWSQNPLQQQQGFHNSNGHNMMNQFQQQQIPQMAPNFNGSHGTQQQIQQQQQQQQQFHPEQFQQLGQQQPYQQSQATTTQANVAHPQQQTDSLQQPILGNQFQQPQNATVQGVGVYPQPKDPLQPVLGHQPHYQQPQTQALPMHANGIHPQQQTDPLQQPVLGQQQQFQQQQSQATPMQGDGVHPQQQTDPFTAFVSERQ